MKKRRMPKIMRWVYVKGKRKLRQATANWRMLGELSEEVDAIIESHPQYRENPVYRKNLKNLFDQFAVNRERG